MTNPPGAEPCGLPDLPRGAAAYWALLCSGVLLGIAALAFIRPDMLLPVGGGALAVLLAFAGSRVILPIYFATTFGGEIKVPGLPVSLNRALALLLFASFAVEFARARWRLHPSPAMAILVAFHAYILGAAWVKLPEGGTLFVQPAFYLVIAFAAAAASWRPEWRTTVLWSFAIISTAHTLVGLAEFVLRQDIILWGMRSFTRDDVRINGIARDAIQFGFNCCWGSLVSLWLLTRCRGLLDGALAATTGIIQLAAGLLTLNRQIPFILAAMLLAFVLLCRWEHRRKLALALAAGALLAIPALGWKLSQRFATATSEVRDASLGIRYDKAITGWEMLRQNPWTGIGHNYFQYVYRQYRPIGETVIMQDDWTRNHTVDLGYVQVAVEYGIVGGAFYLALLLALGASLWLARSRAIRAQDTAALNFTALLAALLVQHLVSQFLQDTFGVVRTYLLMGWIIGLPAWTLVRTDARGDGPP